MMVRRTADCTRASLVHVVLWVVTLVCSSIVIFFINNFSVWVSSTPTPRTKISIDVPVDRIPDIKSKLDAGMKNCPSWVAQEGSSLAVFFVFHALTVYMLNRDTGLLWVRLHFVQPFQDTQICQVLFVGLLLLVLEFYLGLGPSSIYSSSRSSTMSMYCDTVISSRPTTSSAIFFRSVLSTTSLVLPLCRYCIVNGRSGSKFLGTSIYSGSC